MWVLLMALAGASDDDAERHRLHAEILTLAQRNAWGGVDRKFRKLEGLGLLGLQDYHLGAQAAIAEGDLLTALDRLERGLSAASLGAILRDEVRTLRDALVHGYGYVDLLVFVASDPELIPVEAPFATEARNAIEAARKQLSRHGRFLGMLPIGTYTLADETFTVYAEAPLQDVRVGLPPASGYTIR